MAKRTLIVDMEPNQFVEGAFAIHNAQLGQTRNGKPFLKCLLADRSGRTPGRMWNMSEQLFAALPTDGFVKIEGQTQPYQGEMQIIVQSIEPIEPTEQQLMELLPTTPHDIDDMCDELVKLLDTVDNMPLRYLLEAYLHDDALMEKFRSAPAAMSLHHAYLGGLLEHTLSLVKVVDAVCPLYPQVNRDLVLMGAFLHDLGKCAELRWAAGFGYTDEGQLVGHIAQGALMLHEKIRQCREKGHAIPDELAMVLQHIILSHHGKPEFGALKLPATPEALMISMLDNLDAKMHMAISAAREGAKADAALGGNFTEKIWALETRLYRPDVAAPQQPEPEAGEPPVAATSNQAPTASASAAPPQRPI